MPPLNYRVSQPETVTDSVRVIFEQARSQGRLALVVQAARYMIDELAYDPTHFGESRQSRTSAKIWERVAFCPPLRVHFGVHEETKQVFIFESFCSDLRNKPLYSIHRSPHSFALARA
jgi:hypothetical protein